MSEFPDTQNFRGLFTPSRVEADVRDLEVQGVLPDDLEGVFYRIAPDPAVPGLMMNTLVHMDHISGRSRVHWCGPGASFQEPVFAPKSARAPEGEGYLLAVVNLLNEHRSAIEVLDAQHLDEGPIATIQLPLRLRPGLHGNWVPAAQPAA